MYVYFPISSQTSVPVWQMYSLIFFIFWFCSNTGKAENFPFEKASIPLNLYVRTYAYVCKEP